MTARDQTVTRLRLGDGHLVVIVDVDPATLTRHQRLALDALRAVAAELRDTPVQGPQRPCERSAGPSEGHDTGRRPLRAIQGTSGGRS